MTTPTIHFSYKGNNLTCFLPDICPRDVILKIGWVGNLSGKCGNLLLFGDEPQSLEYFGIRVRSEQDIIDALVLLIEQKKLETLLDFLHYIGNMREDYMWLKRRHFKSKYEESLALERDEGRYNIYSLTGSLSFIKKLWAGYQTIPSSGEYNRDDFSNNGIRNLYIANAYNSIAISCPENAQRMTRVIIYRKEDAIHLIIPKIGRFIINLTRDYTLSPREISDCILEEKILHFIPGEELHYFTDSQEYYHLTVKRGEIVIANEFLSILVTCINKHIMFK